MQDMNSMTVLVLGKGGVGKSSTVNSLIGEQVVRVSPFQVRNSVSLSLIFLIWIKKHIRTELVFSDMII